MMAQQAIGTDHVAAIGESTHFAEVSQWSDVDRLWLTAACVCLVSRRCSAVLCPRWGSGYLRKLNIEVRLLSTGPRTPAGYPARCACSHIWAWVLYGPGVDSLFFRCWLSCRRSFCEGWLVVSGGDYRWTPQEVNQAIYKTASHPLHSVISMCLLGVCSLDLLDDNYPPNLGPELARGLAALVVEWMLLKYTSVVCQIAR